jgi:glycerol-3-phosphate acyltransferase PlsY
MLVTPSTALLRSGGHEDPGSDGPTSGLVWLAVPAGFLVASVPFSYLMARRVAGVDLRRVGSGTVSGTGLFEVAGFGPLALAGILEVAKGAVGPLLAGRRHPGIAAAATGAAVIGHNWSPWLRGAGGRGLSPAMGALAVTAPGAALTLLGGMAGGRLAHQTAVGTLLADAAAVPVAGRFHGRSGAWAATAVVTPMIVKRLAGNHRAPRPRSSTYLWRLVLDRDTRRPLAAGDRPVSARP